MCGGGSSAGAAASTMAVPIAGATEPEPIAEAEHIGVELLSSSFALSSGAVADAGGVTHTEWRAREWTSMDPRSHSATHTQ